MPLAQPIFVIAASTSSLKLVPGRRLRRWYHAGTHDPSHVALEPLETFKWRMHALADWLDEREESCIAAVAHWGVINALTGALEYEKHPY